MKIISVVNQKGGVGKSTISYNLAHCFNTGLRVGLVDTDEQGTIRNLSDSTSGIQLLSLSSIYSIRDQPLDVVIIDNPPYFSSNLEEILSISDFVLIPIKPSYVDVIAVKPAAKLVNDKIIQGSPLKAGIVINMVKPRTSVNKDILYLLKDIPIATLKTTLSERVSFIRSFISNGIFEGDDERAKKEITDLAEEILEQLGI